jgi:hypothetical protein
MKTLFSAAALCMLLFSCSGTADNKVPELASEMCGCFDAMQKNLSPDAAALFKEVAEAKDPQSALMNGMTKLKPDDAKKLTEALAAMGDKNSAIFKCMEAFDQKHAKETTKDRTELSEKLLAAMQKNGTCNTGAAIVNLGLSKQKKLEGK